MENGCDKPVACCDVKGSFKSVISPRQRKSDRISRNVDVNEKSDGSGIQENRHLQVALTRLPESCNGNLICQ